MKIFFAPFLAILALAVVTPVSAGTLALTPTTVSVRAGQTLTLTLSANPQAEANYTVKASVAFTADVLEVTNFTLNSEWMGLAQPGYDSIDNTGGTLVKSAAYPKGFIAPKTFGTITLRAKKAGSASVAVVPGSSLMLNASGTNTYTGTSSVTVVVSGIVVDLGTPTPTATAKPKSPTPIVVAQSSPSVSPSVALTPSEVASPSATPNVEVAAAGGFVGTPWFKGLVALGVVVLAGLWLSRRRKTSV